MYLEVVKGGNVFCFFQPVAVNFNHMYGRLTVETVWGTHRFEGMTKELWEKLYELLEPGVAVKVDLDKGEVKLLHVVR